VLNKYPTKKLEGKFLKEVLTWTKPSVKNLKIFGYLSFKHVLDQRGKKLDVRSEPMIFLGYNSTSSYKMYNPKTF